MNNEFIGDLILVRGLPGSGKSSFGNLISDDVISADDYFIDDNGVYNFDPTKLSLAHKYCEEKCLYKMMNSENRIVICNTFTREWEMDKYFEMGDEYNYRVFTVIVENRHNGKNIHGVDESKIEKMKNRFEIKL